MGPNFAVLQGSDSDVQVGGPPVVVNLAPGEVMFRKLYVYHLLQVSPDLSKAKKD